MWIIILNLNSSSCELSSHVTLYQTYWFYVSHVRLKVQSCKLYSGKYMISLTQITDTEIFAFITVLVFMLLSCKVLFINRKDNRNC